MKTEIFTINFKPHYNGLHRVCYKKTTDVNYTCEEVLCKLIDCQCTFKFSVNIPDCTNVMIEGYIQPECENILSTNNRTPFSITSDTVTPNCKRYDIKYTNYVLDNLNLVQVISGAGYLIAPNAILVGGGGTGGVLGTSLGFGGTVLVGVVNAGSGYTSAPQIVIDPPPLGGTQAVYSFIAQGFNYVAPLNCGVSVTDYGVISNFTPNYSICSNIVPIVPSGLFAVENGNCGCNCVNVTIAANLSYGVFKYYYYDCLGNLQQGIKVDTVPLTLCIMPNTLVIDLSFICEGGFPCNSNPPTVIYGGSCM